MFSSLGLISSKFYYSLGAIALNIAGNQQTAYDSGLVQSSLTTNTSNQWERVVDRAIHQVLGRSPGKGANNFINALNSAFPGKTYDQAIADISSISASES